MNKLIASFSMVLAICIACKKEDKHVAINFSLLSGNSFILKIDRVSQSPDVQYPHDSLSESKFTATGEEIQYVVAFSDSAASVTITPGPVSGEKINNGLTSKKYNLTNGLIAGGRFVVWLTDSCFEAEYTKYGSGVPIIRSERGKLVSAGN